MINYFKDLFIKNKINILIIIFYAVIVTVTMFHHEMWRDEGSVWVFLTKPNIKEILNDIRFSGHVYLWFGILFPLVKLNFNEFSMQIISALLGILSVIFFVYKSPFDNIIKCLFVYSAGMLYFLPIIARDYIIIPLIIFILANLYNERLNHPYKYIIFLILISQTHCIMWGFFGICSFFFFFEIFIKSFKEKNMKLLFCPLLLILYIISMFMTFCPVFLDNHWAPNLKNEFFRFSFDNLLFFQGFFKNLINDYEINNIVFYIILCCSCLICLFFFKYNKKIAVIFAFSSSFVLYIFMKVWSCGIIYQKIYTIILILVFCCWIILKEQEKITKFFKYFLYGFFLLLFFCPLSFIPITDDIENTMTNIKEIKNILNKGNENIVIITPYNENFNLYKIYGDYFPHDENNIVEMFNNNINTTDYVIINEENDHYFEKDKEFNKKYIKILDPPKNKIKYYDTGEYYTIWKNKEL